VQLQLEPRPTRQLNLKADPALVEAVDRIAGQYGVSRSAIARAFIRQGLNQLQQEVG
jgi:predicted transcriptional regulator